MSQIFFFKTELIKIYLKLHENQIKFELKYQVFNSYIFYNFAESGSKNLLLMVIRIFMRRLKKIIECSIRNTAI